MPWRHIGRIVDVRVSDSTVEVFVDGTVVKTWARIERGRQTDWADYPPEKVAFFMRTPTWCRRRAVELGPSVTAVVAQLLETNASHRLRSAQRVIGLADRYSIERLDAACARALAFGPGARPRSGSTTSRYDATAPRTWAEEVRAGGGRVRSSVTERCERLRRRGRVASDRRTALRALRAARPRCTGRLRQRCGRRVGLRSGTNAVAFGRRADKVFGVDVSPQSLAECGRKMSAVSNCEFIPVLIESDAPERARELLVASDVFLSLRHRISGVEGVLRADRRHAFDVLKPGGCASSKPCVNGRGPRWSA